MENSYFLGVRVDDIDPSAADPLDRYVGHAMITFTDQTGETQVFGIMPREPKLSTFFDQYKTSSVAGNIFDQPTDHTWDFEKRVPVSVDEFDAAYAFVQNAIAMAREDADLPFDQQRLRYHVISGSYGAENSYSCVSFVKAVLEASGASLPAGFTSVVLPAPAAIPKLDLAYDLRAKAEGILIKADDLARKGVVLTYGPDDKSATINGTESGGAFPKDEPPAVPDYDGDGTLIGYHSESRSDAGLANCR